MRIAKRYLPLLLLLAVAILAGSCRQLLKESFKPPQVRVREVALDSNPVDDPKGPWTGTLGLEVDNPNAYAVTVSHVVYTAIVGRDTVAEGEHRSDLRIEASRTTTVGVPFTIHPEPFREAMRQVLQARRLAYEFNGSVTLVAPLVGTVRVPFSKTGTLDPVDLLKRKGFGFN